MYILIGISGFVAIGFSFFKAKPVAQSQDKSKEVEVISTLECPQCNLKRVRAFLVGDYIFKKDEPCTRCEGHMTITRINARKDPKKKD
jgi:ribosomal protein L33